MYGGLGLVMLIVCAAVARAEDKPLLKPVPVEVHWRPAAATPGVRPVRYDEPLPTPRRLPGDLEQQITSVEAARQALKDERDSSAALAQEPVSSDAARIATMRQRIAELMIELARRDARARAASAPSTFPLPDHPPPNKGSLPPIPVPDGADKKSNDPPRPPLTDLPTDPLALGNSLFRAGDYDGAASAYRLIDLKQLKPEERPAIQYLMACCLRKLGKIDEATALYREVANAKADQIVSECAQWQLGAIRWRKDLEAGLEQVRQKRKPPEGQK